MDEFEKRYLFRRLIPGLDPGQDEDVDRAWLEDAQRRYKELRVRVVQGVPVEEALANAKARLGQVR